MDLPVFLKGLNSFIKTVSIISFSNLIRPIIKQAAKAYSDSVLTKFQQDWYVKFYGKRTQRGLQNSIRLWKRRRKLWTKGITQKREKI